MKIIEWHPSFEDPGYYGFIQYAEEAQQECFGEICRRIENNEYVDVGDNESYLYAYINRLRSSIKNANRGKLCYENGKHVYIPSDIHVDKNIYFEAQIRIRNFI